MPGSSRSVISSASCGRCCCTRSVFFFQAEDGIRDHCVTGVQTCALPIWRFLRREDEMVFLAEKDDLPLGGELALKVTRGVNAGETAADDDEVLWGRAHPLVLRSEERRVGKESRFRWCTNQRERRRGRWSW